MKQLLLVHDSDVVMNALGLVLEQEGYEVCVARSLTQMAEFTPDMVLADAYDPSVHGHGSVADLKLSLLVEAPVYLFGSGEDEGLKTLCERTGADGYVCTEWGFKRLISVVRRAVNSRPSHNPLLEPTDPTLRTSSRVLVLDDHAGARDRLVDELQLHGYAVQGCADLTGLESLLPRWDPDVIVADVILKGIPGDQICRQLKSRMSSRLIPIILISSLPEPELKQRAERAGADAYFRKQDGLPKLVEVLQSLLSEIVF